MGKADYWKPHDFNTICDRCGKKYKGSELKKTWDGLMVCDYDWEPRHPQDFVRGIKDNQSTPFSRPEISDIFIYTCTINGNSSIPGYATPGCSIPGNTFFDSTITN